MTREQIRKAFDTAELLIAQEEMVRVTNIYDAPYSIRLADQLTLPRA